MRTTIALVGFMAGGKGTISAMLQKKGYAHFSYGDEIAKEVDRRLPGVVHTRDMRSDTAEFLRLTFGTDVLARRVASAIDAERAQGRAQKAIIDGLRHPDEIFFLREHFSDIFILGLTVPDDEVRYTFYAKRARELDQPITPQTFRYYDDRDRGRGQPPHGNHVDDCLPLVDTMLINDSSPESLAKQLQLALVSRGIEGNSRGKERD